MIHFIYHFIINIMYIRYCHVMSQEESRIGCVGRRRAHTGVSPSRLMFGRKLQGKFPEIKGLPKHTVDMMICHRDRKQKQKMKQYANKRGHTAMMKIKVGDTVLCRQERKHSMTPLYDPDPIDGSHWFQGKHD